MKKKIIIGSIIAVVILVSVSFTSVVGFQNVESNSATNSPLYSVRTNRAIGEENTVLTYNYVSKGTTLLFPGRNDKALMVQKVINGLRKMDDKTFEKFIASVIDFTHKDKEIGDVNPNRLREALYQLRSNDESIPILDVDEYQTLSIPPTYCLCLRITIGYGIEGFLACILLPLVSLVVFMNFIFVILKTILGHC